VLQHSLPSSSGDVCSELADARNLLNASFHVNPIEVRARYGEGVNALGKSNSKKDVSAALIAPEAGRARTSTCSHC
jgi:hypothetical protein